MKKRPSFQELAQKANVSTATVSRIARGQVNVDAAIKERVRLAAEELGIDLDQRRNEKSTIIAFLLANRDILHNFQARILFGAENYCSAQSKELLFLTLRYSPTVPSRDLHLPRILNQRALVRAVILGGTNSPNMLDALREREIPFSVLGNNVLGEWASSEFDAVYSDDTQGAFDLTGHLITEGHRDIWFIGDNDLPWYARCATGYRERMTKSGLMPRFSEIHSDDRQLGYLAMRSILSRREPVTAVIAGSDQIARGVYEALQQAGLRIPADISVAGFNDSEAALMDPPLTSVREFPEELGKHLAEFVLRRVQEPDRETQQLTIPTRVVVRASTRAIWSDKPVPESNGAGLTSNV
ncbi:LacI family DNA-binding transcriptional regulator [Paludibaculum fermentans]|uniref:LacI family DNA-binding transcriptional regulator n=1 Tax=Paludibaculum fermentans TaxID=1473598 RepID=A0A7S7NP96_PALFE|nr:LacI family DNA-binding transcriptional regulator [Paludibaculum fermentans]QOY87288.1 LacI family DNA-binding transcriptional regulator [Paludibaculum fermentans]